MNLFILWLSSEVMFWGALAVPYFTKDYTVAAFAMAGAVYFRVKYEGAVHQVRLVAAAKFLKAKKEEAA